MKGFQPMLAGKADLTSLSFPLYVSPKFDGIRAVILDGKVFSRKLKPIPNRHVRHVLESMTLPDLDGELIVGPPNAKDVFNRTSSAVMSEDGEPSFMYYVFDVADHFYKGQTFTSRYARLQDVLVEKAKLNCVELVVHTLIHNVNELEICEAACVENGYEGIMLRGPNGPYKWGRSTTREGWLLKLKRFSDEEGTVVGFKEKHHNNNAATVNELGHTKRSSHKANLVRAGVLGSLIVKSPNYKETFDVGTGFDDRMREEIWKNQSKYLGRLVKFKHQPSGAKDKPRFPVFLGWRSEND